MIRIRYYKVIERKSKMLIALLFPCFYWAQTITIDNRSDFPVEIKYAQKKVEIGLNEKKTINDKNRIQSVAIIYKNDKKLQRNISLFLHPQESLAIHLIKDTLKFKGEKEQLHDYVYRGFGDLNLKITEYQKYYQNNDAKGFIRTSEMYLEDALKKAERLNSSPSRKEDIYYKEIENIIKKRWFFTVFVSFDGGARQLSNTGKELMLYYFEKYFKENIATYSCDSWDQYDILRKYSQHHKLLNLKLPKYEIVEHTEEDEINQYLPAKCQEEYFRSSYNFLVYRKDLVRAERYKKVLAEKFHVKP